MKTPQKSRVSRPPTDSLERSIPERLPFTFASWSIASESHPERNEDNFIVDQRRGLVAVFDGVGGSTAGEIASGIARRVIHRGWKRILAQLQPESPSTLLEQCDPLDLPGALLQLVQEAHEHIRTEKGPGAGEGGQRTGSEDQATTVALAVFCRQQGIGGYHMVYASVGDSRIYLLREGRTLTCLTRDDSFLTKLVQDHVIKEADALRIDQASHLGELSETELSYFHKRNGITQALGDPQPLVIHLDQIAIGPGDRILLCTDGIHDNLTDQEMEEIVRYGARTTRARVLVEQAVQRSRQDESTMMRAKPDDMSAVVVTCKR
jgi:PPM family protein phosphatase